MRLRVVNPANVETVFPLEEGSNLIGRWDPESGSFPEVDLEGLDVEAKISRKHALIYVDGGRVELEDAGSLNGTFINRSTKIEPGARHPIERGDQIVIGEVVLVLEE